MAMKPLNPVTPTLRQVEDWSNGNVIGVEVMDASQIGRNINLLCRKCREQGQVPVGEFIKYAVPETLVRFIRKHRHDPAVPEEKKDELELGRRFRSDVF